MMVLYPIFAIFFSCLLFNFPNSVISLHFLPSQITGIGGQVGMRLIFGIKVLGTKTKIRKENKVSATILVIDIWKMYDFEIRPHLLLFFSINNGDQGMVPLKHGFFCIFVFHECDISKCKDEYVILLLVVS